VLGHIVRCPFSLYHWQLKSAVGNLWPMCQMWPAWTFDVARIRIFVTQVRVQHCVKTKLYDKKWSFVCCYLWKLL